MAALLVLAGCSDGSLFLPEHALANDIRVRTVDDGALLAQDAVIPLELEVGEDARFDRVVVSVRDQDGTIVEEFERSRDDFGADLNANVSVASLPEGVYVFEIEVYDGQTVISSQQRNGFVVGGDYQLSGVSSYPARVHPGARTLLRTSVDSSGQAWLRWSVDGEVLAFGSIGDGFEELEWQVPDSEGVYRVRVDLYPFNSEDGSAFDFGSNKYEVAEVYVSETDDDTDSTLGPASSYYALFPLRGDFRDDGVRTRFEDGPGETVAGEGTPFGEPSLRVEKDMFGYYLDGHSGFSTPGLAVPFIDNSLAPFSLNMLLSPDGRQESRKLFRTESKDGSFAFALETDASGIPQIRMRSGDTQKTSSSRYPILRDGEGVGLSVSVSPGSEYTTVMWFADGQLASLEQMDIGFPSSPLGSSPTEAAQTRVVPDDEDLSVREGRTVIGDEDDGFVGLVDEVGVYFRDSQDRLAIDDGLFHDAMQSRFATRLAYAQGFEGLFMPEELRTVGRVTVRSGELVLEPDSAVHFPAFLFEDEDLIVELELGREAREARGEFVFHEAAEEGAFEGRSTEDGAKEEDGASEQRIMRAVSDGSVVFADGFAQEQFTVQDGSTLLLRFRHESDRLLVRGGAGEEYEVELSGEHFDGITMTANHPEERNVALRVLSVLAHRDRTELAERLDFSQSR